MGSKFNKDSLFTFFPSFMLQGTKAEKIIKNPSLYLAYKQCLKFQRQKGDTAQGPQADEKQNFNLHMKVTYCQS